MRTTHLSLPLAASLALATVLMSTSCGKDEKPTKTKVPTKGLKKSQGTGKGTGGIADTGNVISSGQIVVIQDIVFKTGDLTNPYTGLVIWKHENGKRKREGYCEAGIWNGPSKWWYKNSTLAGEGTYKNAKWEGDYKEWHENGKQKVQVTFKDGKENGKEIWWYDSGQIRSVTPYKEGKKEGKAHGNFASGTKSWEAGWVSDFPDGEYWEWYENGDKKSVIRYVQRAKQGKEEHWFKSNGTQKEQQKSWEVTWFKNKKQGIEQHWYPSGINLKALTYEKGVLNGQAASWYQDGKPASQRMFTNGAETYRKQWDNVGKLVANGPIRQSTQPKGRTHQWTQKTIVGYCKGKTSAEIETIFGKADGAGPGGTWMYRGIQVQNPNNTKQFIAANVYFTIKAGKVVDTKVTAK